VADVQMIARLADLREFAELKQHFDEEREEDIERLARKTFAQPAHHDALEWERKKAFYHGVDAVLSMPVRERDNQRKESP
jgi:hypothetical protein